MLVGFAGCARRLRGGRSLGRLGGKFLFQVFFRHHRDTPVAVIGKHISHYFTDLHLQLVYKPPSVILTVLYVAQFFLPYSRQLATFKQLFPYNAYQLYARRRGYEVLALSLYVMSLEERLYDAGTRRRTPYSVLFQRGAQLLEITDRFRFDAGNESSLP